MNCGFYEGIQAEFALDILRNWSLKTGLIWSGGIGIGGGGGFEQAVNEYVFGGERDIAKKCNIIINSDLSDGSGGIHFTTDEYFFAGKSHKNGVHIDFRYWDLYTK